MPAQKVAGFSSGEYLRRLMQSVRSVRRTHDILTQASLILHAKAEERAFGVWGCGGVAALRPPVSYHWPRHFSRAVISCLCFDLQAMNVL